jgi:hypothetical protein
MSTPGTSPFGPRTPPRISASRHTSQISTSEQLARHAYTDILTPLSQSDGLAAIRQGRYPRSRLLRPHCPNSRLRRKLPYPSRLRTVAKTSLITLRIQLSQEEINSLISAFTSADNAFANGFSVAGDKFVTIRADERSLYGKKVTTR